MARLVVAAEIAKIHTIEWTTQLLYDEPLYRGMNGNWNGVLGKASLASPTSSPMWSRRFEDQRSHARSKSILFRFRGRAGNFRPRQPEPNWSMTTTICDDVNGGTNHFGSPFNFPEEFISVYRLHPLIPDLIDYRDGGRSQQDRQ